MAALVACRASNSQRPIRPRRVRLSPAPGEDALVAAVGADALEVDGQAADRRGVGAAVVVDHDDDGPLRVVGDVVQRLPRHPAGQGAVADHRDRVAVPDALDLERPGDAVGPGQGGGGVGVLDDVVLGLRAAGVAGQPALAPEHGEVLAAGEQLVHVGLVAGVEDDPVARGVEDPVQGDGQLDHAEVGAQVPAGGGHGADQVLADLLGEGVEVGVVEAAEHGRRGDAGQDAGGADRGAGRAGDGVGLGHGGDLGRAGRGRGHGAGVAGGVPPLGAGSGSAARVLVRRHHSLGCDGRLARTRGPGRGTPDHDTVRRPGPPHPPPHPHRISTPPAARSRPSEPRAPSGRPAAPRRAARTSGPRPAAGCPRCAGPPASPRPCAGRSPAR